LPFVNSGGRPFPPSPSFLVECRLAARSRGVSAQVDAGPADICQPEGLRSLSRGLQPRRQAIPALAVGSTPRLIAQPCSAGSLSPSPSFLVECRPAARSRGVTAQVDAGPADICQPEGLRSLSRGLQPRRQAIPALAVGSTPRLIAQPCSAGSLSPSPSFLVECRPAAWSRGIFHQLRADLSTRRLRRLARDDGGWHPAPHSTSFQLLTSTLRMSIIEQTFYRDASR
jgi:hypothetical protein